jgi:hypothetical protein
MDVVHTSDVVGAAHQERGVVVAAVTVPRQRIGRGRLTEGEAGELDVGHFNRDIAVAGRVVVQTADESGRVESGVVDSSAVSAELKVSLAERADHAVFSCGAGIDRQGHTRTAVDPVGETVALAWRHATITAPERSIVDAAAVGGVDAQITTQLDAGVGARNVEETGTIQGADPHVFDRFGLYGKVSCLCPTHGDQTRR